MLIESGDLIPVRRDAIEVPWTKRKAQIMAFLFKGPVNFQTHVYDTNVGDIAQVSTYFNPQKWTEKDLNDRFAKKATLEEITAATTDSQGPGASTSQRSSPVDGASNSANGEVRKARSASLQPRLMVLAPLKAKNPSTTVSSICPSAGVSLAAVKSQEDQIEDLWTSVQSSFLAPLAPPPVSCNPQSRKSSPKPNASSFGGVIKGSEKLNEKVFVNMGGGSSNSGDRKQLDLMKEHLPAIINNIQLLRRSSETNTSALSRCSSRSSSRSVSRQSSISSVPSQPAGSGRNTPNLVYTGRTHTPPPPSSILQHPKTTSRPASRQSNTSSAPNSEPVGNYQCDPSANTIKAQTKTTKASTLPEGLRYMLESLAVTGYTSDTPEENCQKETAPVTFDPSQPPPSLLKTQPTGEWTSTSNDSVGQCNGLSGTQFSIPPPGYSTGIPKLDDAVKKIGDAWPDRLLAPWTHPHPSSDKSQELKAAWAENKDCPEIPLFEFCEIQSGNIPKLSIYDDIESVKAKGVKLRLVRPLMEHSSRTRQSILADIVNTENLLELPTSNYFSTDLMDESPSNGISTCDEATTETGEDKEA